MAKSFPSSQIDIVYLPSALSIYNFGDCSLKPAPIRVEGRYRENVFSNHQISLRNEYLRTELSKIAMDLSIGFIDTTSHLKLKARSIRLHGPRDPIHFNREGYEALAEILKDALKKS